MSGKIKYEFSAEMWKYSGTGSWYFITLPADMSKEIRGLLKWQEEGWGRMRATARIQSTEWETSIWFDTKMDTYLLPVKAEIRKRLGLVTGKTIEVCIWI